MPCQILLTEKLDSQTFAVREIVFIQEKIFHLLVYIVEDVS